MPPTEPRSVNQDLADLAERIDPERSVLLLGAGASISSGAPSGSELAREISAALAGRVVSDDLIEASTLLEARYGREALTAQVRARLSGLKPAGGLVALAQQPWSAIYTTNFDRLVELAYSRAGRTINAVRSNYEYGKAAATDTTPLFKLHGCITQDIVDGHHGRMVLTENDYDEYASFRSVVLNRFALDCATKDVLIVGQSLRDKHLRDQLKEAHELRQTQGAPGGRLFALVYDADPDRLEVQRRRGFTVATGSLDQLVYALTEARPPRLATAEEVAVLDADRLRMKPLLSIAALDTDQAVAQPPDVTRMFHGRAASYADIESGFTFERAPRRRLAEALGADSQFVSLVGAAGVGKTSLARQLLLDARREGAYCWEHVSDFPLDADAWLSVEAQLYERGAQGVLMVDDCTRFLRYVNRLVDELAKRERLNLRLVLSATRSAWRPRLKSRHLFGPRAVVEELSVLTDTEIDHLVNLAANEPAVRALVQPEFALLARSAQARQLRMRARADMFVCLKNVFATEELDNILLQEYADLSEDQQAVYLGVAAIQAIGGRAHRQLVLRLLDIRADQVAELLDDLAGIVDEYTIWEREGLYGWETRHPVIAGIITQYKYSSQDDLYDFLDHVIEHTNPAVRIELNAILEMCNADYGVRSLTDKRRQLALYRKLVELVPGERIPRHRLIGTLLDLNERDLASQEIRLAESVVGLDRPLLRYKVRLALARAKHTPGIRDEDRAAIIREAERHAIHAVARYADDKFSYISYADAGMAMAELTGDTAVLDEALTQMAAAVEDVVPDPALRESLDALRRRRERLPQALGTAAPQGSEPL